MATEKCGVIRTTPACAEWHAYAGDTNNLLIEVLAAGDPVNLTTAVFAASVKTTATDPAAALQLTVQVVAADQGRVMVSTDPAAVTALLAGAAEWAGVWDIAYTLNGATRTILGGPFKVYADVTGEA